MRIGVEIRDIHFGASGGIAPLIRGVVDAAMKRRPDVQFVVYATLFNSDFFSDVPSNVRIEILPPHSYWQRLGDKLRDDRIDVLFRGYPGTAIAGFPAARQIVQVPDVQHEDFPQFFSKTDLYLRRRGFRCALQGVGAIGTISEFARQSIAQREEARGAHIFLMPPASQLGPPGSAVSETFAQKVQSLGDYFYYPANLWQHKNHRRLLEAFAQFRVRSNRPMALVLTGHSEGVARLLADFPALPVHHLGFVSTSELRYLYTHAIALTFFSLYEGFGIPLLEAFECNCPVICSNTTSLPEVGAEAVLACDPTDVEAMARLMERVTQDEALRSRLIAAGRGRLGLYTWESSADAFLAACERVAQQRQRASVSQPLVSIVTPSYNQGAYLRRTIESVLTQTYPNIEYIICDGGSTDDSVAILRSYGDRIRWVSEKDAGQADAINKGFAQSHGEIRAYLNSDDTLWPDAVAKVVRYFQQNPDVDMVYGDASYVDTEDRITGRYNTAPYSFARLMFDCCVCQPAAFWRASIAEAVGEFDASLHLVMDYDYWLRIDRAGGTIRYLPEMLANSRLYPETKTLSRRGEIYDEIFAVCRRHGGYVDRNYFFGYWNHRIRERDDAIARMLRMLPAADAMIARIHHAFAGGPPWRTRARSIPLVRAAWRRYRAWTASHGERAPTGGVQGFFWDGWLAPRVRIDTAATAKQQRLYLVGRPARPCTLQIYAGDEALVHESLVPDTVAKIDFTPTRPGPIRLRFSAHVVDPANRSLAFMVLGTNLFSERDVIA
jgi:glycosyltransferase involved in cell wall biosynthesis